MIKPHTTFPRLASSCAIIVAMGSISLLAHADGPTVAPDRNLGASDALPYDGLGYGLAIDGSRMLVGARGSDSVALNGGVIYTYARSTSGWTQSSKIIFPTAAIDDQIGTSLAMSGTVGIAGAPNRGLSGAAFPLRFDGGAWFPTAELTDSTAGTNANFGASVAASSSRIVVGAPNSSEGVGAGAGRVRIFDLSGVQWIVGQLLRAPYMDPNDQFGFAIAIDGEWIAISAPGDDDRAINSGAVYVYRYVAGSFALAHKLFAPTSIAEDSFGQSVAFKNGLLVVGASRRDDAGQGAGAAYVFQVPVNGDAVTLVRTLLPPVGSVDAEFGFAVGTDGVSIVVGAPGFEVAGSLRGGAWIYFNPSSQSSAVMARSPVGMQLLGTRVAITSSDVFASAPATNNGTTPSAGLISILDRTRDCNTNSVPDSIDIGAGTVLDLNGDGTPDQCQCLVDLNGDRVVNGIELAILLANWGTVPAGSTGDLNGDGFVNGVDLATVLGAWGSCLN